MIVLCCPYCDALHTRVERLFEGLDPLENITVTIRCSACAEPFRVQRETRPTYAVQRVPYTADEVRVAFAAGGVR